MPFLFLLLSLSACEEALVDTPGSCQVELLAATPTEASQGDSVQLHARPLSDKQDTALFVGGARATVETVERNGCEDCDSCRETNLCSPCRDCDACDAACDAECEEFLRFEIPEVGPGVTTLHLYNQFGNSRPLDFTVIESEEEGEDTAEGTDSGR